MPSAGRFSADGDKISIVQSTAGSALEINASKTLSCLQSAANPLPSTGIPTGIFTIPEIDQDIKNCARIDFNSTDLTAYSGKTLELDGVKYFFTSGNPLNPTVPGDCVGVDITEAVIQPAGTQVDVAKMVSILGGVINTNANEPARFVASGISLEILPSSSGGNIDINVTILGGNQRYRPRSDHRAVQTHSEL